MVSAKKRRRRQQPRVAVATEDPPRSNHYRVINGGGVLRERGDVADMEWGEIPGGWIKIVELNCEPNEPQGDCGERACAVIANQQGGR